MRVLPLFVLIALPLAAAQAYAGAPTWEMESRTPSVAPELVLISSLDARDELLETGAGGYEQGAEGPDPALATMASLVVPGSGQLMQGNTRGYLYLAAEVVLLGGFYLLENRGMDERD